VPAPLDCPALECWEALLDDSVPSALREHFEQHLESCPACQERLHRAEGCGETLRRLGQSVGDPTVTPADPGLIRILERLYEVKAHLRRARKELDGSGT
jgi:anti-sigma factor RsiW